MGRLITGNINRKLWFGVQPSDAADRFGSEGYQPDYINYFYEYDEHYETICQELKRIEDSLGILLPKLEQFFSENSSYTDEKLDNFLGQNSKTILREYADYLLGLDIKLCLEKNGECEFQAEI